MEHHGPISDFIKKREEYYCDKWEAGFKSCFNCELHLQDDACPPLFWEYQESHRGEDTPYYWICRKWQRRKRYFFTGEELEELEGTADA